MQRTTII